MKTKWQKAFHISLALNNKWLFCWISLNLSHAEAFIWLLSGLFQWRPAVKYIFFLPPPEYKMYNLLYAHGVPEKWLPTEMFIETAGLKLADRHAG